jgi:hypothetical protein
MKSISKGKEVSLLDSVFTKDNVIEIVDLTNTEVSERFFFFLSILMIVYLGLKI